MLDKALITNAVAVLFIIGGSFSTIYDAHLLSIGLFALSGALTNWLAIHMLFEKVPFLYGSGVIPNRFEGFKKSIKHLIMEQFFQEENLQRFISEEEKSVHKWLKPGQLIDSLNYDTLFHRLVDAIMESSFGDMLDMFGGRNALDNLKLPVIGKIKEALNEMVHKEKFQKALAASIDSEQLSLDMKIKIETIVDQRLDQLTPQLVKEIIQALIKEHLGWLVVWGGVLGGLIGLGVSLFVTS